MAKTYTEAELKRITISTQAKLGQDYLQTNGTLWRGNKKGTLDFITDNFAIKSQVAVSQAMGNTESANINVALVPTNPVASKIDTSVNQMKLGDLMAFAATN